MAYNMKGFGGFKSSPAQLKENYEKGFKNMSDKQLKNVVKRHEARGTSKKTAFESIKDAETSIDSLQTAKKELNRRKLDKMDPSGRIRKSRLLPKKSAPTKIKDNYNEGFKEMTTKQLFDVIKRNDRALESGRKEIVKRTQEKGDANSIYQAMTANDSTNAAKRHIQQRIQKGTFDDGSIKEGENPFKMKSPVQKNQKLIDKAAKMGKKGTDMLKKMFDIPATRAFNKIKRVDELYKGVNLGKRPKPNYKYPKIAAGVKGAKSKTDKEIEAAQATLNKKKKKK
jgi:hypothetical protein